MGRVRGGAQVREKFRDECFLSMKLMSRGKDNGQMVKDALEYKLHEEEMVTKRKGHKKKKEKKAVSEVR